MNTLNLPQQEIALRAYHLYLDGGCPNGRDWEHWFRAEQELGSKSSTPPATQAPVSASSNGSASVAKAAPVAKTTTTVAKAAPAVTAPTAKKIVKKVAAKKAPAKKATKK